MKAKQAFNKNEYEKLLSKSLPYPIRNEKEYQQRLSEVEELMMKGESINAEEEALLVMLSLLIEAYEAEHYPIDEAPANEVLKELMAERRLKQADLLEVCGCSSGVLSEIYNGKRAISKAQAKKLGEFFNVPVSVFL